MTRSPCSGLRSSILADEERAGGVRYHYTDEQLRAYASTTIEQRLRWLQARWRLLSDALPRREREIMARMRAGGGATESDRDAD